MPTPQTNTTLEEIAQQLSARDNFVLCGHVNPDGDCLGSQLALYHALRKLKKHVTCVLAKPEPAPSALLFLPGMESMVFARDFQGACHTFVALDVPTPERIGDALPLHDSAEVRFTIDHHATPHRMAEFSYTDAEASATTLLVWEIIKMLGALTPESAQCALCGLITDTGRFAYQNTTPYAFSAAAEMMQAGADPALINREFYQNRTLASVELERIMLEHLELSADGAFAHSFLTKQDFDSCGAVKADAEPLIDVVRSIRGVRVALILRQTVPGEVRGSLRAKDDHTDVASIARIFGGGGHVAAAGFTYNGDMEQARIEVTREILQHCCSQECHG